MSVSQFDALLVIEPHIKKKTTNFCELSVQGSIYSALCCETKWMNLTIAIPDFGVRWYGGSELSKHLSKCLLRMRKTEKNLTRSELFYDGWKFQRQCVNVIDITWGRIYFSTCENFGWKFRTQCAMAFTLHEFQTRIAAPLTLHDFQGYHLVAAVCTLHDRSTTGDHTLHNFSSRRIANNYELQPNTQKIT